ncbi:Basic helix-loop-helix leucine zipper transcription factor [Artemisia annua]|uniref:Basic helix-loop-helix leucine zipper transcription factor n=1 Tax=Artemisia annua TaxID=35608 RepID=A0A2U1PC25_ARTAN|nr:Basic helix-loop-helix leucine zipper transcription factor [Artemisia annua]
MVPYPAILPSPSMPNPVASAAAAAAQLGQRFPVPGFNMSPVSVAGQAANMSAPMMSSFPLQNQNQPRVPNFADPYQQYLGLHQTQNQGGIPPTATKPGSSKDATNPDHHQNAKDLKFWTREESIPKIYGPLKIAALLVWRSDSKYQDTSMAHPNPHQKHVF